LTPEKAPEGAFFAGRSGRISGIWLTMWSLGLAWCWLLPNHYPPWSSFHMDAWAAIMWLAISGAVLWHGRHDNRVSLLACIALAFALMPLVQRFAGQVTFNGTAWLATAYLLGFGLAILIGYRWERHAPGQLGDGLFMALTIAGILCVGLQLHQWLQLDRIEIWAMGDRSGRPYANMGQPNQLATMLLWALIALAWLGIRKKIHPGVLVLAALFFLTGLALTLSRTGWIGLVLLCAGAWYWRIQWPWRHTAWTVTALVLVFFGLVRTLPMLHHMLHLSAPFGELESLLRMTTESRPQIWAMFVEAIMRQPWMGYGWNQVSAAQVAVAVDVTPIHVQFSHAHNIFLDLMLWCGAVVGGLLTLFLCHWMWRRFRTAGDAQAALLYLFVLVIANHAMLELPLHYLYFLLPTGVVMGALDARAGAASLSLRRIQLGYGIWLVSAALLTVIVRDYLRVEASYQVLRFEWANFNTAASREPPDVWMLDQLRGMITLARFEPTRNMSAAQLAGMRDLANLYPTSGIIHKYAAALAWNHQPDAAALWLQRMCAIVPAGQCAAVTRSWKQMAANDPDIAVVSWPNEQN
jgi:O-antigen ligase